MPKSRIVVTNPVDKIDPNKVKELMARLGQKSGTSPASEDSKKVKKRSGTGNRGNGSRKPNNSSDGNKPDNTFSDPTKRWHPSSRNTNGTDIPAYPFPTPKKSKIKRREVDAISGADKGNINVAIPDSTKAPIVDSTKVAIPDSVKQSSTGDLKTSPSGDKQVTTIPLTNRKVTDVGDSDYARFAADMIKASNSYTKTKDGTIVPATNDNDMYNIMINRRLRPLDVQKFLIRQANAISDNDMESKFAKPSLGVVSNKYSDAAANLQNEVVRFQTALDKNKPAYKRSKASDFIETRYSSENGTPKLFWGALIGAGVNMTSSLIGGISAKKQAAEQAKIAEQQRLKAEAEANLANDQVQLKSYVPSNNPGYFEGGGDVLMPLIQKAIKKQPYLPNPNKVRQDKVKKYLEKYGHLPPSMMANGRTEYSDINVEDAMPLINVGSFVGKGVTKSAGIELGTKLATDVPKTAIQYGRGVTYKKAFGNIRPEAIDQYLKEFAAGGVVENNSFTTPQYGTSISPNAQFLTNADGSTYGDHSTGNEVPIYNKDKKLIALAHPREILYTKPDGDQVVLSEARGYSTAYSNLQNMINERKVKLFKTRRDPKGDISRDIQDLVKAQVGLVAKQEEDSANPNQMKYGGRVRRKDGGGNVGSDDEILNRFANNQSAYAPVANPISTNTFDFNNHGYPAYFPVVNFNRNDPQPISKLPVNYPNYIPVKSTLIDLTKREAEYKNPIVYGNYSGPTIKPTITFEQTLSDSDLTPRKITDPNTVQTWLNKQPPSTWDKIKGVIKDPAVQNAGINTLGNLASNIATNSYLSAADKTVSGMKPVHVRYAPINERVDTSGQEASAQNAYNAAKSEINNVTDPTRRSALLNDLTGRYVSSTNEIAGNRINAEISKQNANITAANQVSAQNAATENAMNQYKTEAKAGILGAKSTNMGSMMTKIMQGIQDYRLGQNDKAKLDMVLQRFKSGVADRMDYDALENIFGIIKGNNKDGK